MGTNIQNFKHRDLESNLIFTWYLAETMMYNYMNKFCRRLLYLERTGYKTSLNVSLTERKQKNQLNVAGSF